jgi:hypothetical protein
MEKQSKLKTAILCDKQHMLVRVNCAVSTEKNWESALLNFNVKMLVELARKNVQVQHSPINP